MAAAFRIGTLGHAAPCRPTSRNRGTNPHGAHPARSYPARPAAGLAATTGAVLVAAPATPAQASQDFWRWCRQCQGLWFGFSNTPGVCPAPGSAGHSLASSGNYHLDVWN